VSLHADADGLHQVLVNLILNAVQAMPKGGTLRLATARAGDGVAITVADTGTGIAAQHLPHIFEPFFSTKAGDAGRTGSGLGLSVSYGIVTAHRGRIEVASSPGAGTTFTVWLPLRAADEPAPGA
jgi:signal transduction histidine kinase